MADDQQLLKATVCKFDAKLGLVFGWGIVCCEKNASGGWDEHFDLQGDHIPEDLMVEATSDFMLNSRAAHDMHKAGSKHGNIVHSFPLTAEIAEKMGIQTDKTGWMVAMKPCAEVLSKYANGDYRGFSIGGGCAYELEEAA